VTTLIDNQLGLAMLISVLGMFAVMFSAIYIDVRNRRAAEAKAHKIKAHEILRRWRIKINEELDQ
jgi:hypothetical protein